MIHVMARITVKPEAAPAARQLLESLAAASRSEAGCRSYQLFQQADAAHVFQTVEEWADKAAADGHMQMPHVASAIAAATPLFAAPPEILVFEKLP